MKNGIPIAAVWLRINARGFPTGSRDEAGLYPPTHPKLPTQGFAHGLRPVGHFCLPKHPKACKGTGF